jgi:pyruvyltransferase
MRTVKLVYWNGKNLGDYLSPFIINKLSGLPIKYKDYYILGRKGQGKIILDYILKKVTWEKLTETLFFFERNILGIGSIIAYGNKKSLIWGSGFMNQNEHIRGGKILAVRGRLTNEKIINDGYKGCNVFGDPALLLPLIVKPALEKKYDLAIIPHWKEYDYFQNKYGKQYKILDIRTTEVDSFVKELTSCQYILSTSLHGIILSHAYGIPALWIKHGYIETDGFKFYDYFSSVEIPFYDGFEEFDQYLKDGCWEDLFDKYTTKSLPRIDIRLIQRKLLNVAPFRILDKYRN